MVHPTKDLKTPTAEHLDVLIDALKELGLNAVQMAYKADPACSQFLDIIKTG